MVSKTNLTQYDWACLRVEFVRSRVHVDDWIATLVMVGVMLGGFWLVSGYTKGSDLLAALGGIAVLIAGPVLKHYSTKKAYAELAQAEKYRDRLYDEAED